MSKTNKSRKLLQLAYAAHKRGETEIAKDIFVLAADESDAPEAMGGDEMVKPNPDELKAKIAKALQDGDMDQAQSAMDELKACGMPPAMAEEVPAVPVQADDADGDDDGDADDEDAAEGSDDDLELPPAQIASLVKVAKKIAAAGHKDLAERITSALAK